MIYGLAPAVGLRWVLEFGEAIDIIFASRYSGGNRIRAIISAIELIKQLKVY
jgi:hypothetical protein